MTVGPLVVHQFCIVVFYWPMSTLFPRDASKLYPKVTENMKPCLKSLLLSIKKAKSIFLRRSAKKLNSGLFSSFFSKRNLQSGTSDFKLKKWFFFNVKGEWATVLLLMSYIFFSFYPDLDGYKAFMSLNQPRLTISLSSSLSSFKKNPPFKLLYIEFDDE